MCATAAQAQIQREVDVTRAYEPSVENALKLNITPDMTDTVQLRPDFRYEITPRPLVYGFPVDPISPARFAAVGEAVRYPFYAKLGIGGPMQSVADLRYAKQLTQRLNVGAYATHQGQYSKIKNDMDIKESASGTDNRAGAFLDYRAAKDLVIGGELDYRFRNVHRYGYYAPGSMPSFFDTSKDNLLQFYHDVQLRFSAGNSFTDRDKVNFRVGAGIDYFAERYKYDQFVWNVDALVGFRAGYDGFLTIGGDINMTSGSNNMDDRSGMIGKAGVAYHYDNGDFRVKLGAEIGYSETKNGDGKENRTLFLPQIRVEKDLLDGGLTPFADLRSEVTDNSFGELMKRNPYTFSGVWAPNTVSYQVRAGIKGGAGSVKYKVYGGYDMLRDNFYWANVQEYSAFGNAFTTLTDSLNVFRAGAEIQANIRNAVTLNAGVHYANYSSENYSVAAGLPEIKADFSATYNHRKRLYVTLGLEMIGERTMFELDNGVRRNVVPWQADLRFGLDYFVTPQFGVFFNANNLLNHDIYEFNRYRGLGTNGMVGVKISF